VKASTARKPRQPVRVGGRTVFHPQVIRFSVPGDKSFFLAAATRSDILIRVTHEKDAAMNIQIADFMLHIDEPLTLDRLLKLQEVVRENDSVISVGLPAGKSHLMMVAYNPQRGSAVDILERVEREGCHAELVGF
jgi:hypothetical protein